MAEHGWELLAAETGERRRASWQQNFALEAALLDYVLPRWQRCRTAQQLKLALPDLLVIMMTGSVWSREKKRSRGARFPSAPQLFLATDVMNQMRGRLAARFAVRGNN